MPREILHVHLTEEDFEAITNEYAEAIGEDCAWDSEADCPDITIRIPQEVEIAQDTREDVVSTSTRTECSNR
jgi:hypothetical protein